MTKHVALQDVTHGIVKNADDWSRFLWVNQKRGAERAIDLIRQYCAKMATMKVDRLRLGRWI